MAESGDRNLRQVWRYYDRTESRIGYKALLGGTKHFGWYEPKQLRWRFSTAMRQMEDALGERLDLPPNSEVLDAGCGMGEVARGLASRYAFRVTGIDILDFNLSEARSRSLTAGMEERTRFVWGDFHSLDFADESFDGVYSMESVVHASDADKVLAEFYRVLRPGGRLVMFEYSSTPESEMSPEASEALRKVCDLAAMPTWLAMNHGDWEQHIKGTGFVVESVTDITDRMLPMLSAFAMVGRLPYLIGRLLDKEAKVVNAMSGVEMWAHKEAWRYNIYVATKP